jgi:hypothetical protein
MTTPSGANAGRPALALNLELSHGRPGASARVELHDRPATDAGGMESTIRRAHVSLHGCVDGVATTRIARLLDDLNSRGAAEVILDCADLRHIDFREVPDLVAAADRFEAHGGCITFQGLSRYLIDLFRLAGCASHLHDWPMNAVLQAAGAPAPEPGRERAS